MIVAGDNFAAHPGGTPVGNNEISYSGGGLVVTVAAPTRSGPHVRAHTPDCPAESYCFYDRTDFGYPRGVLSACGWTDLTAWGLQDRIESGYANVTRGSVIFFDRHLPLYRLDADHPGNPDVIPYRNRATRVYRTC
jgi:hypothetical protein